MMTAEQIYLQYHDKVRAYVRGKNQDPHDVEDIVSAVFMKIVQKLDSYDPAKASVSTWVYTITRNTVPGARWWRWRIIWWMSNRQSSATMSWIAWLTHCLPAMKRHAT